MTNPRDALDNLTDAMVDDILSMSDEEMLAEISENEAEYVAAADRMRALFETVKAEVDSSVDGRDAMLTEEQGRALFAQIQNALPEDSKFVLIVARANIDEGQMDFLRLTELPKQGSEYLLREFLNRETADVVNDFKVPSEIPTRIPLKNAWAIDGDGAIVLTNGEGCETGLVMVNYGPGADQVELRVSDLKPLTKPRAAEMNRDYFSEGRLADDDGVYRR